MTIDEEAGALVEAASSFHDRMARHRAFRERWGRRLGAGKRSAILATADALAAVAADLRSLATVEPAADPLRSLIDQARALGIVP